MLESGFQTKEKSIGDYSCYFSTLIHIAELETGFSFDLWTVLELCSLRGYVLYNFGDYSDYDNFTVQQPDKILELLTNKKWKYTRIDDNSYKARKGEYDIRRWSCGSKTHFNMSDWDSYNNSLTVKNGAISGHRIFSLV